MPLIVSGTDSATLPVGTTAQRNASPVAGMVRINSTTGVKEYYNGTNWLTSGIISGTAVTLTNQTTVDFTSIPAGVKRITVMFSAVSTSGSSNIQVQIGSGSVTSSGYAGQTNLAGGGTAVGSYSGAGFLFYDNGQSGTNSNHGHLLITNITGNIWVASGMLGDGPTRSISKYSEGSVTLGGTLDRVRITTVNGSDTFDAGILNIMYE